MLALVACQVGFGGQVILKAMSEFTRMEDPLDWVPLSNFRSPRVCRSRKAEAFGVSRLSPACCNRATFGKPLGYHL